MATAAHFSLEHYERMVKLGAFDAPYRMRLELIRGEIVEMSPIGTEHSFIIDLINEWSIRSTMDRSIRVRVQNPIRIPISDSEPEPDIVWAARKNYADQHPEPHEVLLVIEVAESSLAFDRGDKLAIYAEAGIQEYWIVNLVDRQIEVYRDPIGKAYQTNAVYRGGEGASPLALPEAKLLPASVFDRK